MSDFVECPHCHMYSDHSTDGQDVHVPWGVQCPHCFRFITVMLLNGGMLEVCDHRHKH